MNSPVEQIKERLGIEELVSSYIKLDRAGSNLKAKCPFHNEKTPSFFVSPERGTYYCFGCGASGDVFTFIEEFEGLDFKGALKLLADRAGVKLEYFDPKQAGEKERLYLVMAEAVAYYKEQLSRNEAVNNYLQSRGLNEQSIQDFELGFAEAGWHNLQTHLKTKGFSETEMTKAGLTKQAEKGAYDRFRGRIMFPIKDSSGRTIAFSGRIFIDDGKSAKYLNSPETPIFNKSAVLYGIDKAKDSIRKNNFSILVEGQMDLIIAHQSGYRNTLATSGTALSDTTVSNENVVTNLGLIRRLSPNIVLAFDADRAGTQATTKAGRIALSLGMDVKVADMPEGIDPADLICDRGVDAWREAVKESKHIIEFLLGKAVRISGADTRKLGREIKEKILPFVNSLDSSIEQSHFIEKISETSGISQNALQDDLRQVAQESRAEQAEIKEAEEQHSIMYRKDYILRKLLGIVFWQEGQKEQQIDTAGVLNEIATILETTVAKLREQNEPDRNDLIFEAEVFYGDGLEVRRDVTEMLLNLKEEYLKDRLAIKMRELHQAEQQKNKELSAKILKECQDLNTKIEEIKNGRLKN